MGCWNSRFNYCRHDRFILDTEVSQHHRYKKGVRNNVKNVIREELEVNLKSLKNENTSQSKGNIGGIKIVEATHSIMETWSFESAVKSGNYILLNKILRKEISEIYALMELANRQSKDIFKMTFVIITTEIELANHKEIMKIQNENFIIKHKELIPKIESLIKKLNGS